MFLSIIKSEHLQEAILAYDWDGLEETCASLIQEGYLQPDDTLESLLKGNNHSRGRIKRLKTLVAKGRMNLVLKHGLLWLGLYRELRAAALARPSTLARTGGVPLPLPEQNTRERDELEAA